ncbi:ABC transporter permease [Peribacillus asahii]|uniref:ABC transporter permease n=1 Tax=Peribacillus asahii TaxID=228899 RepID=UPI002079CC59|nr:ABC transporter permease subunit [Peribacillus asahii]USK71001.1 ABC transporter permease [Peribacillus asahii]
MPVFYTLLKKEMNELVSSHKLLIVPIVSIILMITYPISIKLLPTLLERELPKGATVDIPMPTSHEIMANVFLNFETMGVLILILISMGTISGERDKAIAPMVLVKPVGRNVYFLSKWFTYSLLASVSFLIGMTITSYYTNYLFEEKLIWEDVALGTLLYLPILLFVITLSIFFSSFVKNSVSGGLLAFVTYLVITKVPQYLHDSLQSISPYNLIQNANQVINGDSYEVMVPLFSTLCLISVLLLLGTYVFRKQEI